MRRGTLASLAEEFAASGPPKGEIVLLVGPPVAGNPVDEDTIDRALREALAHHSPRDAAPIVAAALGLPKRVVYARALELAGKDGRDAQP